MMKVKAKNGKDYYLVEVIAHILKYLKDELIRLLNASHIHLEATDFDWVITVPAIWRARGKQMMREAGYKVCLNSELVEYLLSYIYMEFLSDWFLYIPINLQPSCF